MTKCLSAIVAALWMTASTLAFAQEVVPTAQTPASMRPTAAASETLARMIALHLDSVPLEDALHEVGAQAHVSIMFSVDALPAGKRVSLVTDRISVRNALAVLLDGTGMEAIASAPGLITLQPAKLHNGPSPRLSQQGTATLSGAITDSGTGAAIPQVAVHIDGTSLSVKSSADGLYKIPNIAAGEYRVTARRVGYLAKTRTITLADGDSKKLDFGLNPPATQLNEVVTTALGEQRRYQVGNVISTINVDSIEPNAPATSVTDIISGRAPGVEVMEASGLVGSGGDIRIRGQSSMLLQSDPIIIVDGIRQDNTPGGVETLFRYSPSPSRLNDLDISQIASIDILKGPTATTEYGTDASNGVIVITTKRGVSGHAQWTASANYTAWEVPTSVLPNYYWNWGQATNGNDYGGPCVLAPQGYFSRYSPSMTAGSCMVDSVTAFNPEKHAATSEYGTGPSAKYDLGVGGGSDVIRYFFAGDWNNALGPTHLPSVFLPEAQAVGFPRSAINPNSQTQSNLRANTYIRVSSTVDVQTNVAYMSTAEQNPFTTTSLGQQNNGPLVDDSAYNYGYGAPQYSGGNSPLSSLALLSNQQTERWTGSSTITMRPASWLAANLTVGIDHGAQTITDRDLPVDYLVRSGDTAGGSIGAQQTTNDIYTMDFRGNATTTLFRHLQAMTSFGLQFVETSYNGLEGEVGGLSASAFSLDGSSGYAEIQQMNQQVKTGGAYIEENFGFGDRCYIPVALRLDAASGFGASVAGGSSSYPKYGLSCLVLTGQTTLRVRGSFGAAGQQPPYGAALQLYGQQSLGPGTGPTTSVLDFTQPGNATLQAERSQEFEGGFDFGLWGSRLQGEFSAYSKQTQHALYTLDLGFDLAGSYTENIGDVSNTGWEATLSAVLIQSTLIGWSVTVNTSVNNNKLVTIAPGILTSSSYGLGTMFVAGYPLYGYWTPSYTFADRNQDGILELDEIRQDTAAFTYQGNSLPPEETLLATSLKLLRGAVIMNALFDYKTGFKVFNDDYLQDLAGANVPTAPLYQQAAELARTNFGYSYSNFNVYPGTFLRFRELSISYALPRTWGRALRLSNLSLVGGVRNLALWTRYPFGDPEVSNGQAEMGNTASNTTFPNNDARGETSNVVPLNRLWSLRLNVGW